MLEAEYLQECDRAELLGLPKPDRDKFIAGRQTKMKEEASRRAAREAAGATAEEILESGVQREQHNRVGEGLDELNARLKRTQKLANLLQKNSKPINKLFKTAGELRKLANERQARKQTGVKGSNVESEAAKGGDDDEIKNDLQPQESTSPSTSIEYNHKDEDPQLSKLDSLIRKAEMAEMSLSKQNKQMRAMISSPKKHKFFFF